MTAEEALLRLAASTADAVESVLTQLAPGLAIVRGESAVLPKDAPPLASIALPAVAASVSYVDGVTGGNVFAMTLAGAQGLASSMLGAEPAADRERGLTELELSAVAEAMNQMMAAGAAATGGVLGEEIEISAPETVVFTSADEAAAAFEPVAHAVAVAFSVNGEPCRLVQLVPNAFVVRMTRALADLEAETVSDEVEGRTVPAGTVRQVPVRVWAELGRIEMPFGRAVGLPAGAVVELDHDADDPVDLYVNGRHFGTGSLVVVDGSDWAVRIESIFDNTPTFTTEGGSD